MWREVEVGAVASDSTLAQHHQMQPYDLRRLHPVLRNKLNRKVDSFGACSCLFCLVRCRLQSLAGDLPSVTATTLGPQNSVCEPLEVSLYQIRRVTGCGLDKALVVK